MEETDNICFICDKEILSDKWKYKLQVTATKKRKVPAADLIKHIVGEEYAVLVGERDAVCRKCMDMLNLMDSLTAQLGEVTSVLKGLLHFKYNLASDNKSVPFQVDYDDSVHEEPLHKCSVCKFQTKYEKELNIHIRKHSKTSSRKKSTESMVIKKSIFTSKAPAKETSQIQSTLTPTSLTLDTKLSDLAKSGHRTRSTTNSLKKKKKISLGYDEKLASKPSLKKSPRSKKPKVYFQCSICEEMFLTESSITLHAEKVHGKEHIEVTEEEEYADIQTLESEDEIITLNDDEKSRTPSNKLIIKKSLDFLDDWQEDESNDETTSPTKMHNTEIVQYQSNISSNIYSKQSDNKKNTKGRPRKRSASFDEESESDDKDTSSKPTCLFCHAEFSSVESVQDHIKMTHRDKGKSSNLKTTLKKTSCETVASFEIDSTTEVTETIKKSNVDNINGVSIQKSYKCNVCGIKKVSLQFIQKHVKVHKRKLSLQCKFCGVLCKNIVGLKVHAYKCHKIAPVSRKCKYCKFRFIGFSQLKNHVTKVHHKKKIKSSTQYATNCVVSNAPSHDVNQVNNDDQSLLDKSIISSKKTCATDSRKISFGEVSSTSLETEIVSKKRGSSEIAKQDVKKHCCQECNLVFDKTSQLRKHNSRHKANNCADLGICIYCTKVFLSKDQVMLHNSVVHANLKTTPKCDVCGKLYSYLKDLKIHCVQSHHTEKIDKLIKLATEHMSVQKDDLQVCSMTYSCPLCSFEFEDKERAKTHLVTHTKNYCHICKNIFSSQESIKHIENHSVMFQGKRCNTCDSQFHDDIHLVFHMQNVHPIEKKAPNKCSMCTNSYLSQRSLLIHKHKKHAQKTMKMLSCGQCKLKFFSEKKYKIHAEFAHRPSPNCKYCDKGFGDTKTLVLHEKNHLRHVKSIYKCNICGKVLKSLLTLKTHKTNHVNHGSLKCDECGRNFKSFYALREHSAKHSESLQMKYFCDICNKGFYFYDSHCRHRRNHLELPKFK